MRMADTDWTFSHRSAAGFSGDAESDDDDNEENVGDAGTSSRALQQIDLAAREDSAQYKPNPWSIAKVNAASRPRQPNATSNPILKEPVVKKPPQRTIVDAFKRQAQTTTKSSAQASRLQTPLQKPAPTSAIGASDDPVSAPALLPASVAHITTPAVDLVPIPSRPRQYQETPPPSFLPKSAFLASHSSQKTDRTLNFQFTSRLDRVQPSPSPVRPCPHPRPQGRVTNISGPPQKSPASFGSHILRTPTLSEAQIPIGNVIPASSAHRRDINPSQSDLHSVPVEPGSKVASPHLRQNIWPPPRSGQPIIEVHPKFEMISPSSSFAQARRFFEYGPPPVPAIKQPSPGLVSPAKGPPPSPPRSHPVIASPPRKQIDPYDQLLSSPDSEWSTLRSPTQKNATFSGKSRSKPPDVKSGKFRLPLTMASIAPSKEPPQKKPRVITYLPPPKKQKTVSEHPLTTEGVGTAFQNPRTRTGGLPSPPPSDETAPPSSPTPSVQFDSNGVLTRYKLVRAKIRQRKALDVQLWDLLGLESCGVAYRDPEYTPGGVDAWNGEIAFVTWHPRRQD